MEFTLVFHSIIRWAIILFGAWTVINALTGLASKRPYSANDNRSSLFFMIFCDVQLILGLILLFSNTWIDKIKSGMGPLMKDPTNRFFVVEHGMMMMIAWALVHIGRSAVKKTNPEKKHKKMLLFFGLAFLIIIISIPWPNRAEVARPLMRWFN